MKKVVLKVDLYNDRIKQKAMKSVSGLSGVESVSVDMEDRKLTLVGKIDPIDVVGKLKKWCHAELVSVGPAKDDHKNPDSAILVSNPHTIYDTYPLYNYHLGTPHYNPYNYYVTSGYEDPNGCVIC